MSFFFTRHFWWIRALLRDTCTDERRGSFDHCCPHATCVCTHDHARPLPPPPREAQGPGRGSGPAPHQLDVVAGEDELVLDRAAALARHARQHADHAHNLLAQEVADLHARALVLNVDVDGEVGIHEAHLVLVALGHTGDHVLMGAGAGGATGTARQNSALARLLQALWAPSSQGWQSVG
jgi:hypothetical protein